MMHGVASRPRTVHLMESGESIRAHRGARETAVHAIIGTHAPGTQLVGNGNSST
jgi:hypothetical protein